jgi:hypothetical protein
MWTQIAGEQAQLQAIDQNPPGWRRPAKKRTLNRSSRLRERKGQDLGVSRPGWQRYPSCATKPLSPPLRLLAFSGPLDPLGFAGSQLSEIGFVGLTSGTR